jgi:lipoprotein-releasing system permease protein
MHQLTAGRIAFNKQQSFSGFIRFGGRNRNKAAMLLTVAFTNGFNMRSDKIFSFSGHIRVQHFEPSRVATAEESPIVPNDTVTWSCIQTLK